MRFALVLDDRDDVAVLIASAESGSRPLGSGVPLAATVQAGHKIARHAIAHGAPILKFGRLIGYATEEIAQGSHVHSHKCVFGEHAATSDFAANLD